MRALVDTSYLIALERSDDQDHAAAKQHWRSVRARRVTLYTTTYIFAETIALLNGRGFHDKAVEVGTKLLESPDIRLVRIGEPQFRTAWDYLKQHPDKNYSLTDCISFIVMQRRKITTAFTFDHH